MVKVKTGRSEKKSKRTGRKQKENVFVSNPTLKAGFSNSPRKEGGGSTISVVDQDVEDNQQTSIIIKHRRQLSSLHVDELNGINSIAGVARGKPDTAKNRELISIIEQRPIGITKKKKAVKEEKKDSEQELEKIKKLNELRRKQVKKIQKISFLFEPEKRAKAERKLDKIDSELAERNSRLELLEEEEERQRMLRRLEAKV